MTSWEAAAVVATALVVLTAATPGGAHRIPAAEGSPSASRRLSAAAAIRSAASVVCVGWILVGGPPLDIALGVGVLGLVLVVRNLMSAGRARRRRRERQLAVIEVCDALSAELRGGLPAAVALERACSAHPDWASVVAASRLGSDVVAALRRAAREPGAEGLAFLAAGWEIAGSAGAALAAVLEKVAAGLRSDEDARAEVVACLGPVRATAKLLAVLPVFGLALGSSMGARPVRFLVSTGAGVACLGGGLLLVSLGVLWVERLAGSAEV
jgi:tight adherence protein B